MRRSAARVLVVGAACAAMFCAVPERAPASVFDKACGVVSTLGDGLLGKACKVVTHPKQALQAGKALLAGKPGQALKKLFGAAKNNVLSPSGAAGIVAVVGWAVGGAHFVLSETAKLVAQTTSPELTAAWFSSVYLRVTGVAALLTLPFLCAAAIQAMLRSDGALLARAVFGYLPLSFLATAIAAPVAMILLSVTDWMGGSVSAAAGGQGSHFLVKAGVAIGALGVAVGSPFVTFLIALLTAAGGLILWLELLVREAAVYVVVLMLPLVFAAMVWPARRVWATRAVEVLVALILAKFAIVSVLALGAAALGHSGGSLMVKSLAGLVLVLLGAFAPWVLLRLLPLAEVASSAAGHVRDHAQSRIARDAAMGGRGVGTVAEGVSGLLARMQGFQAEAGLAGNGGPISSQGEAAAATIARLDNARGRTEPPPGETAGVEDAAPPRSAAGNSGVERRGTAAVSDGPPPTGSVATGELMAAEWPRSSVPPVDPPEPETTSPQQLPPQDPDLRGEV